MRASECGTEDRFGDKNIKLYVFLVVLCNGMMFF